MANLAIKGHATRGEEVIEILGILGGSNVCNHIGNNTRAIYYIDENYKNFIICSETKKVCDSITFTLEEFLEKFPYKVGDKVKTSLHFANCIGTVKRMRWEQNENVIIYDVEWSDANKSTLTYYAQGLRPYKEQETMDKANKAVFDVNAQCCDIINHLIKEETMEVIIKINPPEMSGTRCIIPIPKSYEFAGFDDDKQQVVFEKIGYQYPKTYEECCDVLGLSYMQLGVVGYACEKLGYLQRLLLCRDAYWKIAGEQMGVDKPWVPNWRNSDEDKHCIEYSYGRVDPIVTTNIYNYILAFPTKELRDAFYENFKDLIEQCKDLL